MEKIDRESAVFKVVYWIVLLSLMVLFSLSTVAGIVFLSFCGIGVVVFVFLWLVRASVERLERRICKRLDRQGYRYEKKEGVLYIFKNNNRYRIHLAYSYNRWVKNLYVLYDFGDESFEKVSSDGWCRAANAINVHNTNTVFVVLDDGFCCCYQAAIGNAGDFMEEFDQAYEAIGLAIGDYNRLVPYLERDYPYRTENKNIIGFKQEQS